MCLWRGEAGVGVDGHVIGLCGAEASEGHVLQLCVPLGGDAGSLVVGLEGPLPTPSVRQGRCCWGRLLAPPWESITLAPCPARTVPKDYVSLDRNSEGVARLCGCW